MAITLVRIDTLQIVYQDDSRTPLIGPVSPDGIETFTPWNWDERIWTSESFENSELGIPVLGDPSTRGIANSYWQSGVGDKRIDLEVLKPINIREESRNRWTVQVRHGNYYKYNDPKYLFSDRSIVQQIDNTLNETSRNVLQLTQIPRFSSPILASIWTRDSDGLVSVYRSVQKRLQFSGLYSAAGEASTVDSSGNVIWASVDTGKHEFIVDWNETLTAAPKLYFNDDFTFLVGRSSPTDADDLSFCDFLGEGNGTTENQALFTKYFPILDNSELKLYKNESGVATEMTRWTEGSSDSEYYIDCDRGEITFPTEINDVDSDITSPPAGTEIYAVYRPTLEVEYEAEYANNFLTAPYVNLNPIQNNINRGFIYLTEQELRVSYLTLTANIPVLQDDVYGPLYLGTGYCFLIATAYNVYDQVIPGVEVSFYLDSQDDGMVNGAYALSASPVSAITDGNGEARVVYGSPRSLESIGQYIAHPSGGPDAQDELSLIYADGITADSLDDMFIYQVFADDGMQLWYDERHASATEEPGHGGRKVILYHKTVGAGVGGEDVTTTGGVTGADCFEANSADVLDPATGAPSDTVTVYVPLQPIELSSGTLTFKDSGGSAVDLPWTVDPAPVRDRLNPPGTLVAYWVSCGKQVPVHAKCFSYLYNDYVDSNDIEFRLTIADYLKGVYVDSNDKETPYGFRLVDDQLAASGLDGATFLTINPRVGKWPVVWDGSSLDVIEDTLPTNQSNIVGHQFAVEIEDI